MENLKQLVQIDWWYVILAIILLLLCIKTVWSLVDWFLFEKLGIETKGMKQRRQDRELLRTTTDGLNSLEKGLDDLEQKFEYENSELKECLTMFIEETRDIIKAQDENNHRNWEISKKIRNEMTDIIKDIDEDNQRQESQINSLVLAQKEMLAEKINEKYKYYISIKGIPEDEYEEFVSIHKAYKGLGGNHNGDAKFEYCIEHLPIIPVETKLVVKPKE